jgi:hypothetical protein
VLPIALPRSSSRKCSRHFRGLCPSRSLPLERRLPLRVQFVTLLNAHHAERCPSGLRSTLGKRVLGKLNRGFESHPLRHPTPRPRMAGHLKCQGYGWRAIQWHSHSWLCASSAASAPRKLAYPPRKFAYPPRKNEALKNLSVFRILSLNTYYSCDKIRAV